MHNNTISTLKLVSTFCVLNLFLINTSMAMKVAAATSSAAGTGALIGAPLGPIGMAVGGTIGCVIGAMAGTKAVKADAIREAAEEKRQQEEDIRAYAERERRAREERENFVHHDRFVKAIAAKGEYEKFPVLPAQRAAFEAFERGESALVLGCRAFSDRQPQEVDAIVARINQKLLLLRQRHGMPVDAYTGNYIELNARRAAGQTAIDNPSAEQIRVAKTLLENPEFNELFQDLEKLFIAGKLFWKQSNKPTETLKDIMANVRWATLNAYAQPLLEKLDVEQAQHQQKIRDNAALLGQKQQAEANFAQERLNYNEMVGRFNAEFALRQHVEGEKNQERTAKEDALNIVARRDRAIAAAVNQTLEVAGSLEELQEQYDRFKVASTNATFDAYQRIDEVEAENARMRSEIEGVEEIMPRIAQRTKNLEDENAGMREEIARRRAQSPERRAQLAAKDAEIEKLKRDLTLSREAFASCKLINP